MPDFVRTMRAGMCTIVLAVVLAAGCSSGHSSATRTPRSTAPTTRVAPDPTTSTTPAPRAPAVAPAQAAARLAEQMVGTAVLPAGAQKSTAPLPQLLHSDLYSEAAYNYAAAGREWTVNLNGDATLAFVQAHMSAQYEADQIEMFHDSSGRATHVLEQLRTLPANVGAAELEIAVEGQGSSSLVNVDAAVQWTRLRPSATFVPARDRIATVSVVSEFQPHAVVRRVVVVNRAKVQQLVRAFNDLRVAPIGPSPNCPQGSEHPVSYRVEFSTAAGAAPDVTAIDGFCAPVAVTVDHIRRINLLGGPSSFTRAVAAALGLPSLTWSE